ncbi:MAG: hypothetical protein WCP87_00645, partial [Atribacterota bacterium]
MEKGIKVWALFPFYYIAYIKGVGEFMKAKNLFMVFGVVLLFTLLLSSVCLAGNKYVFAWIPKALNNPVFELGKTGAFQKAKEL